MGNYGPGRAGYEWRRACEDMPRLAIPDRPEWDGTPLDGRTILVHHEHGLGDTLQFARYAPLVRRRGGRVILTCQRPLATLLRGSAVADRVVAMGEQGLVTDVQAPLMSLPRIFGTTVETIPADVPYLAADPDLVERWRERLAPIRGFRIGIARRGNPANMLDRSRSFPPAMFEPLARVEGVRVVGLPKGHGAGEVRELGGRFPVHEFGDGAVRGPPTIEDAAAILMGLDPVISRAAPAGRPCPGNRYPPDHGKAVVRASAPIGDHSARSRRAATPVMSATPGHPKPARYLLMTALVPFCYQLPRCEMNDLISLLPNWGASALVVGVVASLLIASIRLRRIRRGAVEVLFGDPKE